MTIYRTPMMPLAKLVGTGMMTLGMAGCNTCRSTPMESMPDSTLQTVPTIPTVKLPEGVELVSAGTKGEPGNDISTSPSISADGRFIAFASSSSNLTENDANNRSDIFIRDRHDKTTRLISSGYDGKPADGDSWQPTISSDGRFVVFSSYATNLVPEDTNGVQDVFLWDAKTGEIERVNVGPKGEEADAESFQPTISGNGEIIAYFTMARNLKIPYANIENYVARLMDWESPGPQLILYDRIEKLPQVARYYLNAVPNTYASNLTLSEDGRFIAYGFNLTNEEEDLKWKGPSGIIIHDNLKEKTRVMGAPLLIGQQSSGKTRLHYDLKLSRNGRNFCAVPLQETDLESRETPKRVGDFFIYDFKEEMVTWYPVEDEGKQTARFPFYPGVSADGKFFVFSSVNSDLVPHSKGTEQLYVIGVKTYFQQP